MRRKQKVFLSLFTMALLLLAITAPGFTGNGVTVDPDVNDFILAYGDTFSETVTVSIPEGASVANADIYFLADTTGSMGDPIAAVKAGTAQIIDDLIADLPGVNFYFGAGDFKDFPWDSYAFKHDVSLTADTAAVKAGINAWSASGGSDLPEGQFFAYDRLAADANPAGGTIGWRSDAKKILVVFGDAPSHDPIPTELTGLGYAITEASVTTGLQNAGIVFIGISTTTGVGGGMDADPKTYAYDYGYAVPGYVSLGMPGQATRIAAATGGVHLMDVANSEIVQAIKDQVTTAVTTINNVSLVPAGDIAPFVTAVSPAGGYGPLASDEEHVLAFDVDFEGVVMATDTDQVFTGYLNVVADGSIIGYKPVTITVPGADQPCVMETTLYAGQYMDVGTVTVTRSGDMLYVKYSLHDDALDAGWMICETHLAVADTLAGIPQTYNRWGGNPIPGQFGNKMYHDPMVAEYEYCIDLSEMDYTEPLYIAAHAVIACYDEMAMDYMNETAWGFGNRFNERGNWGWYFMFSCPE